MIIKLLLDSVTYLLVLWRSGKMGFFVHEEGKFTNIHQTSIEDISQNFLWLDSLSLLVKIFLLRVKEKTPNEPYKVRLEMLSEVKFGVAVCFTRSRLSVVCVFFRRIGLYSWFSELHGFNDSGNKRRSKI